MGRRRDAAAALLVVCIVLAGCTGGTGGARTTPAAETTETVTTTDSTTAETTTPPTSERLAADHAAALAAADNFTLRWSASLSAESANETDPASMNYAAFVDVATGELLHRENSFGVSTTTTYVSASGETYQRTDVPSANAVEYQRPFRDYAAADYRNDSLDSLLGAFEFEADGTTTLDGERVQVYAVASLDRVRNPDANVTRFDPEKITAFEVHLYVAESGLVKRLTLSSEAEIDGETRTFTHRIEYEDVGSTSVESPSWLDEAKEAFEARTTTPDPSREGTETVRDESLGAAVTVTGPKHAVDRFELDEPSHWPFVEDDGEGFRKAQVSAAVSVTTHRDLEFGALELTYDESAIADADESDFEVYRYNTTLQTLVAVETTVDAEANVARAELDREGTYLVVHTPTWRELWE